MRLYIARHGVAEERSAWPDDDLRPLTAKGVHGVEHVASALVAAGVAPRAVMSSPLARADQTARILGEALGAPVEHDERIAGMFAVRDVRAMHEADGRPGEFMLVGHEPSLSMLLEELTGARVAFKKGACARIDFEVLAPDGGTLVWLVTPALAAR